ncbi:MAG: hypothetical protein DMG97_27555 [Acidobacteria bacterium]|nr:MAG: hypothetical protein DMG97_27555 [Acidobacteriota bacterium]
MLFEEALNYASHGIGVHPHHRKVTGKPIGRTGSKHPTGLITIEPIGKISATIRDGSYRWEFPGEAVNVDEFTDPVQI